MTTTTPTHEPYTGSLQVVKNRDGWLVTAPIALTDRQAQEISWRAEPKQVVMGDFVEVVDPEGTRIGHVETAVYSRRLDGPPFVTVTIDLR